MSYELIARLDCGLCGRFFKRQLLDHEDVEARLRHSSAFSRQRTSAKPAMGKFVKKETKEAEK